MRLQPQAVWEAQLSHAQNEYKMSCKYQLIRHTHVTCSILIDTLKVNPFAEVSTGPTRRRRIEATAGSYGELAAAERR